MDDNRPNSREEIQALRRQATRGARWTAVATGIRIATQLVQLAVLARLLDAADFGLMAMVNVVVVFGQSFGDLGLSNAIIHYQDATRRELSSLYWLNIIAGVAVFAVVWLSTPLLVALYSEPRLDGLVQVSAFVFIIVPLGHQFQVLLERELRFRRIATIEVAATLASAVVGITAALAGYGVMSLVWSMLSYVGGKALLLAVVGWRDWRPTLVLHFPSCRRFMRFAMYQMGDRALNLFSQQMDKLLIGALLGARPLGYYDLAYRLVARPYQLINPIFTRVAFPVFSRVQNDVDRVRKGFLELIEVVAGVLAPIYVAMIALAGPVIGLQLGPGYDPSIGLLRILAIVGFLYGLGNPLGSVLLARGRADVAFYLNLVRILVYAIAIWVGSRFGLDAIAWSLVVALGAVLLPVGFWVRWWLIRLHPGVYIRAFAPFVVCAGAAGAVGFFLERVWQAPNDAIALAVLGPVLIAVYAGLLFLWQRSTLRRILAMVRS
jgi:O-antigen/teichoic acid export membrane protein